MSVGHLKCLVVFGLGYCHDPLQLEAIHATVWSLHLGYDVLMVLAKANLTFTIHTVCGVSKVLFCI